MNEHTGVKTLAKSLRVLECLVTMGPELSNAQIANHLGLSKSNSFDILQTFYELGYMEKDPETQKYSLSAKFLEFSSAVNQHLGYYRVVYDIMDDLSDRYGQLVHFSIPRGSDILYLYTCYPSAMRDRFPYRPFCGEVCPMYCSSMGKAMLAFSEEALLDGIREKGLHKFTDTTLTSLDELERQLAAVRENGYSVDRGEHEYGVGAVGVPVFDRRGKLAGAMSICGMVDTFTEENISSFAKSLKEAAFQIRTRL